MKLPQFLYHNGTTTTWEVTATGIVLADGTEILETHVSNVGTCFASYESLSGNPYCAEISPGIYKYTSPYT
ncbi:MAG: hypothetical protein L3J47_00100 [Sulfurovum sp.]|nr:hypothetical protein [Sulfurovum sp.]